MDFQSTGYWFTPQETVALQVYTKMVKGLLISQTPANLAGAFSGIIGLSWLSLLSSGCPFCLLGVMVPIGEAGATYAYVLTVPRHSPNFQQSLFQRLTVHCLLLVGVRQVTEEGQGTRTAMAMSSATSAKFFRGRLPRSSLQPDLCREVIEAQWLLSLPTQPS